MIFLPNEMDQSNASEAIIVWLKSQAVTAFVVRFTPSMRIEKKGGGGAVNVNKTRRR